MAKLVFKDIHKQFGNHTALEGISVEIAEGEFFTLLGPSGCGKTTMLRLIAGLETADKGEIWIGDRDVTYLPPGQRKVAMVFQNYALYPHMTVAENISYPLVIKKTPGGRIQEKVKSVAERLSLKGLLQRMPSQLSGGQQQRVAVARAMVQDPLVYLFDEPLSNLDAKLRQEARRFLKRIQKETGITAVYVTHDQTEAMAMSDRVAVLKDGRLIQVASPETIYTEPADVFVAGFVGSLPMNLIEGKLEKEGRDLRFSAGEFSVGIDENIGLANGAKLTLGIRPEQVFFEPDSDGGRTRAVIDDVEQLGSEMTVSLSIGEVILLSRIPKSRPPKTGERVKLRFDKSGFHFFDECGNRIAGAKI
ncbi:MAG: ABC transporter ATP-binding protein [Elusimicrobia bacterium]|nr:ABC transporter ATP-binding protein [Elusimicrobiota bacterium]